MFLKTLFIRIFGGNILVRLNYSKDQVGGGTSIDIQSISPA